MKGGVVRNTTPPNFMATKILISDTRKITHEEWLEERKKGIGGSDVSAVLGISPWKTSYEIYEEKTSSDYKNEPSLEASVPLKAGNVLENLIIKIAERLTGAKIVPANEMVCLEEKPYIRANPDAFLIYPDGKMSLVEIKTLSNRIKDEKWGENTIPPYYESQLRYYQGVYGDKFCDKAYFFALPLIDEERALASMFANAGYEFSKEDIDLAEQLFYDRLIIRTIERDRDYEQSLFEIVTTFWEEHVVKRIPPAMIGTGKNNKTFLLQKERNGKTLDLSDAAAELIAKYDVLSAQKAEVKKELENIEEAIDKTLSGILCEMGDCSVGISGDYEVIVKPGISRTTISADNLKKLMLQYPDVYSKFAKTSIGKNRIAIKKKTSPKRKRAV